jgi:hypothetical protein
MTVRSTLGDTNLMARHGNARGYAEEFDGDQQLCLRVKKGHGHYSQTHTDFEVWEPVGQCSVPIKQKEEQGQQGQQAQGGGQGGGQSQFNSKQPKGEAAELMLNYLGGNAGHVIGMVTDRRVKPYGLKPGRGMNYAPDGSEQMLYFKQDGTYLVSLDGKSVEKPDGKDERMVSMRHVEKEMQTHKIEDKQQGGQQGGQQQSQQQKEEYKHEGKKVNTEVRATKNRIEFRAGEKVVGYYEVSSDTWFFTGKVIHNKATEDIKTEAGKNITETAGEKHASNAPAVHHN